MLPTASAPDLLSPHADPPPDLFADEGVDLRDSTDPHRLIPGNPHRTARSGAGTGRQRRCARGHGGAVPASA